MSPKGRVRYMRLLVFFDLPVGLFQVLQFLTHQLEVVLAVQEVLG